MVKLFAFVCLASVCSCLTGGHCVILHTQCSSDLIGGSAVQTLPPVSSYSNSYPCFMTSNALPVSAESCGMHVSLSYVSLYVFVPAGYGFVDFDSPASAQKAVTALKAGGVQAQMAKVRTPMWEHLADLFLYNGASDSFTFVIWRRAIYLFTHSIYSLVEFCSRTLKLEATNQHRVNTRKQQQLNHMSICRSRSIASVAWVKKSSC